MKRIRKKLEDFLAESGISNSTSGGVIPSFFLWLGPWKGGILVSGLGNQNDGLGVQSKGWEDCVCSEKSWPD